jgi:hypothetical protein
VNLDPYLRALGASKTPGGANATPTKGLAATASNQDLAESPPGFRDLVEDYLRYVFSEPNITVDYITLEDSYVQVIVRGLRGRVVPGGRYWERLELNFVLQGEKTNRLRVVADGLLAAGIGGYPPDSQFTRNMEPEYAASLTEYTAHLANGFINFLTSGKAK